MKVFTITEFNAKFPDEATALDYIVALLFPDGITCKNCSKVTKHYRIATRKVYGCGMCGAQTSPTAGTVLHKSPTPLRSWLYAIFLMASTRCGISAKQLQRELGVTYKTAWRMFHQIRKLLGEDAAPFTGTVEADETYVGGKDKNRHVSKRSGKRGRGAGGKTPVVGVVERKGKVVALVTGDVTAGVVQPILTAQVTQKSTIITDDFSSYDALARAGFSHERVKHSAGEYVRGGDIHTNTIEGFWSQLKRSIDGTYHHVSAHYLQRYVDEYSFRYNHRNDLTPMFDAMMRRLVKADVSPV